MTKLFFIVLIVMTAHVGFSQAQQNADNFKRQLANAKDDKERVIIPQDIGRVILNLINNAFYAVNERQKLLATGPQLLANYEPTVSINTRKEGNKILISVKDNGNGIPQKILDKIFQPFFTTKSTGQGTGLGLSLSYDIVKAHGGELGAESEFIIYLPSNL